MYHSNLGKQTPQWLSKNNEVGCLKVIFTLSVEGGYSTRISVSKYLYEGTIISKAI